MQKSLGSAPSSLAETLWFVGMAMLAGMVVLLACESIVAFGVAGRDESIGQAFLCLVYAGLAALLGRWWWSLVRLRMEPPSEP